MSNSPSVAADTPKPAAPGSDATKTAPQQNQDNKNAEAKPTEQQK